MEKTALPKLYNYFRSSASNRVRIALNIKKIKFEYIPVNLLKSEQKDEKYCTLNPTKVFIISIFVLYWISMLSASLWLFLFNYIIVLTFAAFPFLSLHFVFLCFNFFFFSFWRKVLSCSIIIIIYWSLFSFMLPVSYTFLDFMVALYHVFFVWFFF